MLCVAVEIQVEIEQFLAHEARLLEEHRLHEWLALLADDSKYFMPIREAVEQPPDGSSALPRSGFALFDDDKKSLTLRAGRMQSKLAPTEMPPALVQRLITNIQAFGTEVRDQYQVQQYSQAFSFTRSAAAGTRACSSAAATICSVAPMVRLRLRAAKSVWRRHCSPRQSHCFFEPPAQTTQAHI